MIDKTPREQRRPARFWPDTGTSVNAREIAEARRAARDTLVDCAGCGAPMRRASLYCPDCERQNG